MYNTLLKFPIGTTCISSLYNFLNTIHESRLEDMEDLILDTKTQIGSAKDPNTSGEIEREDVRLCHKNLGELVKI